MPLWTLALIKKLVRRHLIFLSHVEKSPSTLGIFLIPIVNSAGYIISRTILGERCVPVRRTYTCLKV